MSIVARFSAKKLRREDATSFGLSRGIKSPASRVISFEFGMSDAALIAKVAGKTSRMPWKRRVGIGRAASLAGISPNMSSGLPQRMSRMSRQAPVGSENARSSGALNSRVIARRIAICQKRKCMNGASTSPISGLGSVVRR